MNKPIVIACAAAAAVVVGGCAGAWALLRGPSHPAGASISAARAASAALADPQRPRPVQVVKKIDVRAVEWDPQTKAKLADQGFTFDEAGRPIAPGATPSQGGAPKDVSLR